MEQATSKIQLRTNDLNIKAENLTQESLTQILDFSLLHGSTENKRKELEMKRDRDLNFQALTLGVFLSSILVLGTYQISWFQSHTPQTEVHNVK